MINLKFDVLNKKNNSFFVYLFFVLIGFLAYYFKFRQFGLYEDDYYYIAVPANSSFSEIIDQFILVLRVNAEGRLIGFTLPYLLVYIFFNLGGLTLVYIFGLLLLALNAYLFYKTIRLKYSDLLAFICALIFLVSPNDTTKGLQIHTYQLQVSLFFLMCGILLYMKGNLFWSYVIASLTLLTYENAFLPFLFIPLLKHTNWTEKKTYIKQLIHFVIIFFIVIIIFIYRKYTSEARVEELDYIDLIIKMFKSLVIGPLVALYLYLYACIETLKSLSVTLLTTIIGLLLTGAFMFYRYFRGNNNKADKKEPNKKLPFWTKIRNDNEIIFAFQLSIVGLLMLIASYLFSFTHYPPTDLDGRETSVHFAAAVSSAIFLGGISFILFKISLWYRLKSVFTILFLLVISLMVGYGMLIQKDFIKSWTIQKNFWNRMVELIPDVKENTYILVNRSDLIEKTSYIEAYSWSVPMVLENLYDFPDDWKNKPRFVYIEQSLDSNIFYRDQKFMLAPVFPFLYADQDTITFEQGNTMYIQKKGNNWIRREDSIQIGNHYLHLKVKPDSIEQITYPPSKINKYMIQGNKEFSK